jgi:FkbM family methyltransferase
MRLEVDTRGKGWRLLLGRTMRRVVPDFRLTARLASFFGRSIKVSVRGKTLNMDLRDQAVSAAIFADGVWELEETEFIERSLRPGMVFVDIGANIGYYSLIASTLVGCAGRVLAFEPDPGNFALLQRNVAENQCENVIAVQKAVSTATRQMTLYRSGDNFGDHRTYEPGDTKVGPRRHKLSVATVEAVSLDEYLASRHPRVDFVKMDIQGSEPDAFAGMRGTLKQNPDVTILTEFWPTGLKQAGADPKAFLAEVRACGFLVHELAEGQVREVSDADIFGRVSASEYMSLALSRKKLP